MRLIVNADDLGYSVEVNEQIFDLIARGSVTSATVITNGPASAHAFSQLPHFPTCSFGVHLNLTEFSPLANTPSMNGLLRSDGEFDATAIRQQWHNPALYRAIADEWSTQVGRFILNAGTPSHIDSHHHVHTIPWLFPLLKQLQMRFSIRRVRISKNIYGPMYNASLTRRSAKRMWNWALQNVYQTSTTAGFTSLCELHDILSGTAREHRDYRNDILIEVMTHPGAPDNEIEAKLLSGNWARTQEFDMLGFWQI